MKKQLLCFLLLSLYAFSCGSTDPGKSEPESYTITDQTLQGKINGEAFTFKIGYTSSFLSDDKSFFVSIHGKDVKTCELNSPGGNSLLVKIPKKAGEYKLSFSQNITFTYPQDDDVPMNKVATKGKLVVKKVDEKTIEASIYAIFDDKNVVDGNFTAEICPKD